MSEAEKLAAEILGVSDALAVLGASNTRGSEAIKEAAAMILRLAAENAELVAWRIAAQDHAALAGITSAAQAERIAELEEALANVRTAIETADPEILVCTLWMPNKWPNETVVDHIDNALARAALGGDNDNH